MIYHDKHGVPVHKGDLVRSFHYIGARRKRHYLYHVAVEENGELMMVPTAHLEKSFISGGGRCPLKLMARNRYDFEVISGHGPKPCLSFEERVKVKPDAHREGEIG
jgi:hypothetical protein